MSAPTPETLKQATEHFQTALEDINGLINKQRDELRDLGGTQSSTSKQIKQVEDRIDDLGATILELKQHLGNIEVKLDEPPSVLPGSVPLPSIGEIITESPQFKEMIANNEYGTKPIRLKTLAPYLRKDFSSATGALGSAGALIDPTRIAGVMSTPLQAPRLRNIIPTVPTSQGSIEFVKETAFHQLFTTMPAGEAAAQTVLTVDNAQGFYDGQTITLDPGGGGEETAVIAASGVDTTLNELTVTAGIANTHAAGVGIAATTFVFTPELGLKPSAELQLTLVTEAIKTLAHMIPGSRQILSDAPGLQAYVNGRLTEGMILSEERQMLYGDGSSAQLSGILSDPDINTLTQAAAPDTKLDALRKAMTISQNAHLPVDGIVLNPNDWETIELLKDAQDRYIWNNVPDSGGVGMRVWRTPVVLTTAIDALTGLVGAFGLGSAIHDREQTEVRISENYKDFFGRNMVMIRAEERLCQTIYRPPSFVDVTFL